VTASTLDHVEQHVLDAAGRALYDIDAAGYVTQYNLRRKRQPDAEGPLRQGAPEFYAGRRTQIVTDPLDQVTRTVYDAATGRCPSSTRLASLRSASMTRRVTSSRKCRAVIALALLLRRRGPHAYSVDPKGYVTERRYDGFAGRFSASSTRTRSPSRTGRP